MTEILATIKKLLGVGEDDTHFDGDILIYINSALAVMRQIGVGPVDGFVANATSKWTDFLGTGLKLEIVKSYVYLKTKLIFDPPQNSSVAAALKSQADECEWRVLIEVDPPPVVIEEEIVEGGDPVV